MEPIGDILSRLAIRRNTPLGAMDTLSNREPPCPFCNGAGFLRQELQIDDPQFGDLVPCICKEREIQEKRLHTLVERSNLSAMADMTFDSFIGEAKESPAFRRAQAFAAHPEGWLVLMGDYGTGKTHLAAAIGNYRLHEAGEPALFIVVPDLLDRLRAAYAPESEVSHDDLFESVRQAPLLILDDLGTQSSTQWAQEKLFQLLNHRYVHRLPSVITTNHSLDQIGGRLASRMSDPHVSVCVVLEAGDFRGGLGEHRKTSQPPTRLPKRRTNRFDVQFDDGL